MQNHNKKQFFGEANMGEKRFSVTSSSDSSANLLWAWSFSCQPLLFKWSLWLSCGNFKTTVYRPSSAPQLLVKTFGVSLIISYRKHNQEVILQDVLTSAHMCFYSVVHVVITNCSTSLSMLTCTSFYFECCQTLCEQNVFFSSRSCSNKINSNGTIFRCIFFSVQKRPKGFRIFNQMEPVIHYSWTARTDDTPSLFNLIII